MRWIKLLKAYGGHEAGTLLEVDKAIADAYIAAGAAEDGGTGPAKAVEILGLDTLQKSLKGYTDGMAGVLAAALADITAAQAGRAGRIDAGDAQADKSKSLGDFVNQIVAAGDIRDLASCQAAQDRLGKVYKSKGRTVTKGQEESGGATGGYWTIPVEYEKTILMEMEEDAVILPGVTSVPLGARAKEWPSLDQYRVPTAGNSAIFGGITVARKGEKSTRDRTQAIAGKVKLEANDLTAYTEFSRDDQQDSDGVVESMLTKLIGGAIGFRRDWEHMWGSGQGMSQGYIGCDAMLYVNRAVDADVIGWADVAAMLKYLMPSSQKRAVFVAHPYIQEALLKLRDPAGNYIYIPAFPGSSVGQAQVNPVPMLANVPVLYTEKAGQPGSLGDFTLCDRAAILSGVKGGIELGLSEHFLFDTDQIALRAKIRDDAQPWIKKPIFLGDGSGTNKVSAFVGLRNNAGTA